MAMPILKIELYQVELLLLICIFTIIQSYESIIITTCGVPSLVFINFIFLFLIGIMLQRRISERVYPQLSLSILRYIFLTLTLFNLSRILFGHFFSMFSFSRFYIIGLGIPFVFLLIRSKLFAALYMSVTLGLFLYGAIATIPMSISGNMLFYIDTALNMILHGKNPYIQEVVGDGFTYKFMGYAPMMLIPYLPFKMIALDIRYLNVLMVVIFPFLWWFRLKYEKEQLIWQTYFLGLFCILTSPYIIFLIATKHIFFVGILTYLLSRAVIKNPLVPKSIIASLVICTRQFLVPVVVSALFDNNRKKMIYGFLLIVIIAFLICFPFAVQNPLLFIKNISSISTAAIYNDSQVDFTFSSSPGGGNSYNLGHMLKYYYPKISSTHNVAIFFFLFCLTMVLLQFKKIKQIAAIYFVYLSFIAFSIQFSSYFFWGICGFLLGVAAYDKDIVMKDFVKQYEN